jgi:hypothetical protein
MAFTPYRPAQPFTLANVAAGQVLNVAAINGVTNSMKHLRQRGRQPVTVTGMRVNGAVIPALGVSYPPIGTFRLSRKYISIPLTIPPHDTKFCMFFNFQLNPWVADGTTYPTSLVGGDLTIDLVQAGAAYTIATASFIDQTPPTYLGSQLVIANLPNKLSLSQIENSTVYLRVYLDQTVRYIPNLDTGVYDYDGPQDSWLDTVVTPFPNLSTFWNGLMNLSFATFSECNAC